MKNLERYRRCISLKMNNFLTETGVGVDGRTPPSFRALGERVGDHEPHAAHTLATIPLQAHTKCRTAQSESAPCPPVARCANSPHGSTQPAGARLTSPPAPPSPPRENERSMHRPLAP